MLFFDEDKISDRISDYLKKPKFRQLIKENIKEIIREIEDEDGKKRKIGKIDDSKVKAIAQEVLNEVKKEKGFENRIVKAAIEKEIFSTTKLLSLILKGVPFYIVTLILFFIFITASFIKHSLTLYILAMLCLLMLAIVTYTWKRLHRIIFEVKREPTR